eukprot:CAMPEP_0115224906 /NCGR_PEP_ID=MMETSP0270-20121206/29814_1 /TAXON_ID=71861 /ORGANISM="Scrippsiella trochoidea, Strain CCMP3099" /LENGTH=37 /DNA_ID= /DNA_START= /DNA_END= /DNA_ORIENTATION=
MEATAAAPAAAAQAASPRSCGPETKHGVQLRTAQATP